MTEQEKLDLWFDAGRLVRPTADAPHFADLVMSLFNLTGVGALDIRPGIEAISQRIGQADHYVLVLVDGMGSCQLSRLTSEAFLRRHHVADLQAVFFSTTSAALTTLATGQYPGQHAVPGWWVYLDDRDVSTIALRFQERLTERSLAEMGVSPGELFTVPSRWPTMRYTPLSVLPLPYLGSVYTQYSTGGTACLGYSDLPQAMTLVRKTVFGARGPSFTYLYLPQLDEVSHQRGPNDERVYHQLRILEAALAGLAEAITDQARLIIVADHGQGEVTEDSRFILPSGDTLLSHLRCRPTGEPTTPIFHVRPGHEEAFAVEFTARFGDHFALLSLEEVDRLRLMGPAALSPLMRRRMGTYMGIANRPSRFYIEPCDRHADHPGVHGGLTPEEMTVPLIIA